MVCVLCQGSPEPRKALRTLKRLFLPTSRVTEVDNGELTASWRLHRSSFCCLVTAGQGSDGQPGPIAPMFQKNQPEWTCGAPPTPPAWSFNEPQGCHMLVWLASEQGGGQSPLCGVTLGFPWSALDASDSTSKPEAYPVFWTSALHWAPASTPTRHVGGWLLWQAGFCQLCFCLSPSKGCWTAVPTC